MNALVDTCKANSTLVCRLTLPVLIARPDDREEEEEDEEDESASGPHATHSAAAGSADDCTTMNSLFRIFTSTPPSEYVERRSV